MPFAVTERKTPSGIKAQRGFLLPCKNSLNRPCGLLFYNLGSVYGVVSQPRRRGRTVVYLSDRSRAMANLGMTSQQTVPRYL